MKKLALLLALLLLLMSFGCGSDLESITIGDAPEFYKKSLGDGHFQIMFGMIDYAGTLADYGAGIASGSVSITGSSGASLSDAEKDVLELATDTLALLKNKDWGALGALVHPTQGLTFSPYGFVDTATAVKLGVGDVKALESDDTVRVWGVFDGSGEPMEYTFAEYYDRFIMSQDFTGAPQIGVDRIIKSGNTENNLYVLGNGVSFVEFHIPGSQPNPDHSWASLRLVFGAHENELYLVGVVHDEWTV